MRNFKYNYTVDFFQDYVPRLEEELRRLGAERNTSNDEGNVSASNNNALQVGNAADARFQSSDGLGELPGLDGGRRPTKRQRTVLSKGMLGIADAALQGTQMGPQVGADLRVGSG